MFSSALLHQTLILAFTVCATALPVSSDANDTSAAKNAWSKEAILGLVAVLVAITLFTIGLATGTLRKWIANPFKCCKSYGRRRRPVVGGGRDSSAQLLRRRAEEWVEFNEWRRLVESRTLS